MDYQEDGSGAGGYAKEMSKEWHAAARDMLTKQCADVDIVVTTALIPGRTAPIMVTKEMVAKMKSGSVTVDLAAEAGGNIETTVPDQKIVTDNGVTCIGYTDMPSRLATTSSSLYANNISKFLLSIGPHTSKEPSYFHIDHEDEAVRGMLVLEKGTMMYPAPAPPPPPAPKETKEVAPVVIDYKAPYITGAKQAGMLSAGILAMGACAPNPAFSSMLTTFALSNIIGVQVVLGVSHALHSPLMAGTYHTVTTVVGPGTKLMSLVPMVADSAANSKYFRSVLVSCLLTNSFCFKT